VLIVMSGAARAWWSVAPNNKKRAADDGGLASQPFRMVVVFCDYGKDDGL
jgi:hypothetical protein